MILEEIFKEGSQNDAGGQKEAAPAGEPVKSSDVLVPLSDRARNRLRVGPRGHDHENAVVQQSEELGRCVRTVFSEAEREELSKAADSS